MVLELVYGLVFLPLPLPYLLVEGPPRKNWLFLVVDCSTRSAIFSNADNVSAFSLRTFLNVGPKSSVLASVKSPLLAFLIIFARPFILVSNFEIIISLLV